MLGKLKREIRVHIAAFEQRHGNFATTPSRLQLESQRRERMIGQKQIGRPKRRNDQDPHRVETRRQIAQEVDGRRVSPVDIVEKQDDRELARHLMEQCAELPLETLGRSRAHLDTLLDRIAAAAGGKQVFVPGRRHRFRQPGERVGVLGAKQAVERLEDRQIRFGPSEGAANSGLGRSSIERSGRPIPSGSLRRASSCRCRVRPQPRSFRRVLRPARSKAAHSSARSRSRPTLFRSNSPRPIGRAGAELRSRSASSATTSSADGRRRGSRSSILIITLLNASEIAGFRLAGDWHDAEAMPCSVPSDDSDSKGCRPVESS